MKRAFACALAALVLGAGLASPASAERKDVLPESARAATRGVEVVVPQAELGTNINPSFVGVAMGGGLIGAAIDVKVESDRAKRAEGEITPLRMALVDFDADQLAIDATKGALSSLPWFQASAAADFARDPTFEAMAAELGAAKADQVAFFQYVYDTSPDFASIRVGVTITIASRNGTGEQHWSNRDVVYTQTLTSVVRLANPGSGADNAARWRANDAALAKRALSTAFSEVGALIPRALTVTENDLKGMRQGERKTIGGYGGTVQDDGPGGTLLFNGGLIHVQTIQG